MAIGSEIDRRAGGATALTETVARVPLWFVLLLLMAAAVIITVVRSENLSAIVSFISQGLLLTIQISVAGYAIALVLGLIAGLGRISKNPIIHAIATLYVEIIRGIPILVVIIYVAFVISAPLGIRSNAMRATIALGFAYGAYLAEVYRAGIQAIPRGQVEAARSLGLNSYQTMRLVVLPQALRIILPPLGNDFIAILKDSSLASAISVAELTQQSRLYVSRTFDTFGGWTMAALLYLSMTLILSLGVRLLERYSRYEQR